MHGTKANPRLTARGRPRTVLLASTHAEIAIAQHVACLSIPRGAEVGF